MAEKYTNEDKKSFAEKDLRIVRQNALSHAVQVFSDFTIAERQKVTPDVALDSIFALANRCVEFVYGGMAVPVALPKATAVSRKKKTSEVGALTTPQVQEGQQAGVPNGVVVVATQDPAAIPPPNKVMVNMAGELAVGLEPGQAIDFDEFCRRVYVKYGKYPTNPKSLDRIKQDIVIPIINSGGNA